MIAKEFSIDGMSCNHCVMAVQKELSKIPVQSFDVTIGSAKVEFDDTKVKIEDIEKAIEEAGFKVRKN
jgi:copper chaperone CopZ